MKVALLASGAGTTVDFLLQNKNILSPRVSFVLVVSDNPMAGVLQVAQGKNVKSCLICPRDYSSFADWDAALARILKQEGIEKIVLAGFLRKIGPIVLRAFPHHILNTHPSLLPKYGGKGMYGHFVHEAVIAAGEKETGVTFHLINAEYDKGDVLRQVKVRVEANDTPQSLENKIKRVEKEQLLEFLKTWL